VKRAILFDRDGTLIEDRPPNNDASAVAMMPSAEGAIALAREWECRIGVISNQPAIAVESFDMTGFREVNTLIQQRVGCIDAWFICPHEENADCDCRKPRPGLVLSAIRRFDVSPAHVAVVGDIGADIEAAARAGALGILVPNAKTREAEIRRAPIVASDLVSAVRRALEFI
jgi:D-glycero-D-manno-heptose 1,7-bisphosphate phosphatase